MVPGSYVRVRKQDCSQTQKSNEKSKSREWWTYHYKNGTKNDLGKSPETLSRKGSQNGTLKWTNDTQQASKWDPKSVFWRLCDPKDRPRHFKNDPKWVQIRSGGTPRDPSWNRFEKMSLHWGNPNAIGPKMDPQIVPLAPWWVIFSMIFRIIFLIDF